MWDLLNSVQERLMVHYHLCWALRHPHVVTCSLSFNPSGVGTRIFKENWVNTMAADALAPCIARSSAAMVLTLQDKQVSHKAGFLLPVPCHYLEIMENVYIFFHVSWNKLSMTMAHYHLICPWDSSHVDTHHLLSVQEGDIVVHLCSEFCGRNQNISEGLMSLWKWKWWFQK